MSDRRHKLVPLAAELAADFATRAGEHDRANSFPVENVDKMKAAGYTALVIPEKHGGLGADLEDFALCQEQLAQGRPQEELFFDVIGRGHQILGGGISEPETGGDWGYFATRARREGETYVLNGQDFHQPVTGDRSFHGDGDD
jgi:alkylation response protein AidB-like acyl-CoA dehydrogenase